MSQKVHPIQYAQNFWLGFEAQAFRGRVPSEIFGPKTTELWSKMHALVVILACTPFLAQYWVKFYHYSIITKITIKLHILCTFQLLLMAEIPPKNVQQPNLGSRFFETVRHISSYNFGSDSYLSIIIFATSIKDVRKFCPFPHLPRTSALFLKNKHYTIIAIASWSFLLIVIIYCYWLKVNKDSLKELNH